MIIFFNLQSCDKFINAPTLISSNAHKHFTDLMADWKFNSLILQGGEGTFFPEPFHPSLARGKKKTRITILHISSTVEEYTL